MGRGGADRGRGVRRRSGGAAWTGRHALVTGASRGIGRDIALALADRGADVTVVARSPAELEEARTAAERCGVRAVALVADLTDDDARAGVVEAVEAGPPVDILVNNAGAELVGAYRSAPPEAISALIDLNLRAPMLLTRGLLPGMARRGRGHVVNIASMAGKAGIPYAVTYSATKAGLVGFTQAMRVEHHGSGIRFSVVCPIFVTGSGMFARIAEGRVRVPRLIGTVRSEDVTAAVIRAIVRDRPETLVGPRLLRPALALAELAPRFYAPVLVRFGALERFRAFLVATAGSEEAQVYAGDRQPDPAVAVRSEP
jgi:short-subunit dehydrogenase